jgi:hypothetical protein
MPHLQTGSQPVQDLWKMLSSVITRKVCSSVYLKPKQRISPHRGSDWHTYLSPVNTPLPLAALEEGRKAQHALLSREENERYTVNTGGQQLLCLDGNAEHPLVGVWIIAWLGSWARGSTVCSITFRSSFSFILLDCVWEAVGNTPSHGGGTFSSYFLLRSNWEACYLKISKLEQSPLLQIDGFLI